jgi:hypothetical protein
MNQKEALEFFLKMKMSFGGVLWNVGKIIRTKQQHLLFQIQNYLMNAQQAIVYRRGE